MTEREPEPELAKEPQEAPPEPREDPETVSPSTEVGEGVEMPLEQEKRSWWQRWFGG